MSSTDEDVLACLDFRDCLNDYCFSRTRFIQWISNEEFLLIFDSYFCIYRLTPFFKAAALADKFPVSVLRLDIDCQSSPSILQHCLNLLKFGEADANFARAGTDVTVWREINEAMADSVFLQPSLAGVPGAAIDPESLISISNVYVESMGEAEEQLFIVSLVDGRLFSTLKVGRQHSDIISVTTLLYDYISENVAVFRAIIPDLPDSSQPIEDATGLTGLRRVRQLGSFLSTTGWSTTSLRLPVGDSGNECDSCGISLQQSGHLIIWRYNTKSDWRNFQIVDVVDNVLDKAVSSGIVLPIDETKCLLLLGTKLGDVLSFAVGLAALANGFDESSLCTLLHDDCKLSVSAMRLFRLSNTQHLLIVARQWVLTAAVLTTSSTGTANVVATKTLRTQCRFAVTDIVRFEGAFYVVSSDKVAKYEICLDKGIVFNLLTDAVIPLDNSKVVGLTCSRNGVLKLDAVMKRFMDRYSKRKPLTLRVTRLLGLNELWGALTSRANLKDAADYLVVLGSFILHHDQSKVIGELLIQELESLESDEDPNVLLKLKIFRFATTVFSGKRSKAEDLEFWNRVREKVERLLVVKVAKTMLARARGLDWSKPMPSTRQATASLIDFLAAEGVAVTDVGGFGELYRPRCPLCDAESFQSNAVSEHVCSNGHRYPACALTFLPIPSFSYRKCSRCDLSVLDRESISDLSDLVREPDYCQFCDGQIMS